MAKLKQGTRLVCVPCGREVIITASGISYTTIWCCGKPMKKKPKIPTKKTKKGYRKKKIK